MSGMSVAHTIYLASSFLYFVNFVSFVVIILFVSEQERDVHVHI